MGIAERKEREKEQRRTDIIESAEKIFFSKGIQNATMDEIAEEAELSKGTLYLYFKSKEELLFAIKLKALKILNQKIATSINPKKPVIENIQEVGHSYIEFAQEYNDYFKILMYFEGNEDFTNDHYLYSLLCGHDEDPMSLFVELLKKGIKEGSIRPDIPPNLLAHILWSQTTGVVRLADMKKFHQDLETTDDLEIINAHFEIIYDGIKKK